MISTLLAGLATPPEDGASAPSISLPAQIVITILVIGMVVWFAISKIVPSCRDVCFRTAVTCGRPGAGARFNRCCPAKYFDFGGDEAAAGNTTAAAIGVGQYEEGPIGGRGKQMFATTANGHGAGLSPTGNGNGAGAGVGSVQMTIKPLPAALIAADVPHVPSS